MGSAEHNLRSPGRIYAHHGEKQIVHPLGEVAPLLNVTPSWLAEKCRKQQIPHTLLGGKYGMTDEHIEATIRMFERKPTAQDIVPASSSTPRAVKGKNTAPNTEPGQGNTLTARTPRRKKTRAA